MSGCVCDRTEIMATGNTGKGILVLCLLSLFALFVLPRSSDHGEWYSHSGRVGMSSFLTESSLKNAHRQHPKLCFASLLGASKSSKYDSEDEPSQNWVWRGLADRFKLPNMILEITKEPFVCYSLEAFPTYLPVGKNLGRCKHFWGETCCKFYKTEKWPEKRLLSSFYR